MMVRMDLVQNPPDGCVKAIAAVLSKEFGNIKIIYDIGCVLIAITIGMIFLRQPFGMGIATLASAIFVGKTVTIINKIITRNDK